MVWRGESMCSINISWPKKTHPALGSVAQLLLLVRVAVSLHGWQQLAAVSTGYLSENTRSNKPRGSSSATSGVSRFFCLFVFYLGTGISGEWRRPEPRSLAPQPGSAFHRRHVTGDTVTHFLSGRSGNKLIWRQFCAVSAARCRVSAQWLAEWLSWSAASPSKANGSWSRGKIQFPLRYNEI